MSKAFLKQRTNGCDTLNPFCSRSSLHLRCVSNLWVYSVTQVHIVRSCCDPLQWTFGTRHTDRDDMQLKVVFLVALISVNTIWIISIYLSQNWAVSQWLFFRTSDLNAWYLHCLCEQTAKVDRSHYIISLSHHKLIRNFNLFPPYKFSKFSDILYTCIVNNFYTDTQNDLCIIW